MIWCYLYNNMKRGGCQGIFLGDFVLAYSGVVFSKTFEGDLEFTSAYSGLVYSKTFEGDFLLFRLTAV